MPNQLDHELHVAELHDLRLNSEFSTNRTETLHLENVVWWSSNICPQGTVIIVPISRQSVVQEDWQRCGSWWID
jgi:hypothetical protein